MSKQKVLLRKALGAVKTPEIDVSKIPRRLLRKNWVHIMDIGIKKDEYRVIDDTYFQEAL